ncbi:MAG TPA: helix-turn-helix transcriptional regulator [Polyangia bacterium]|nr:helix-turn-helix transcriptional regulator [Polyangia bacterium]
MLTGDLVDLIESIYALESSDREWLAGIAGRARTVFGEHDVGAYGLTYDASDVTDCRFSTVVFAGVQSPELRRILSADTPAAFRASPTDVEAIFRRTPYGPSRALPATGPVRKIIERQTRIGVEILGLNGVNVDGRGAHVGVLVPVRAAGRSVSPELLARVSSHLAAAYRLRARVRSGSRPERAEAILRPDGTIDHAEGPAKLSGAREELARAAIRIDRLRSSSRRRDPQRAIETWKALVDARWSLVDHFEKDGTRYLLAQRNDPEVAHIALLSERERQVVALAAIGHHDKMIAYELGISGSTARVLLSRAARKLGARTRAELIAAHQRAARRQ